MFKIKPKPVLDHPACKDLLEKMERPDLRETRFGTKQLFKLATFTASECPRPKNYPKLELAIADLYQTYYF